MKSFEDILAELHRAEAVSLLKLVESGDAPHQVFEVARKFLADNGVNEAPSAKSPLFNLAEKVPHQDPDLDTEVG